MSLVSKRSILICFSVLIATASCPGRPKGVQSIPQAPPVTTKVALSAGDVLVIRVAGERDLSAEYQISDSGTIDFPYIKTLKVAGLKPPQVAKLIRRALANGYIKDPQVSVFAKGYADKRMIYVWGQVAKTGAFQYTPQMPLIKALTLAGGLTQMADKDAIYITRIEGGKRKQYSTPMKTGQSANYPLRPGDVVTVPERVF